MWVHCSWQCSKSPGRSRCYSSFYESSYVEHLLADNIPEPIAIYTIHLAASPVYSLSILFPFPHSPICNGPRCARYHRCSRNRHLYTRSHCGRISFFPTWFYTQGRVDFPRDLIYQCVFILGRRCAARSSYIVVRILGGVTHVLSENNPTNKTERIIYGIMESAGLSPLVMATLGFLRTV